MDDKELLELGAKAALIRVRWHPTNTMVLVAENGEWTKEWNPLTDDGDALRLAVKLNLMVDIMSETRRTDVFGAGVKEYIYQLHGSDGGAATRRAIVMTAAEIGKTL